MVAVAASSNNKSPVHIRAQAGSTTSHASRRQQKLISVVASIIVLMVIGSTTQAATIVVPSGGDLQAALNAAQYGDTIILQAGATFKAPSAGQAFVLPAKSGGSGT